jgi:hypothetical protein
MWIYTSITPYAFMVKHTDNFTFYITLYPVFTGGSSYTSLHAGHSGGDPSVGLLNPHFMLSWTSLPLPHFHTECCTGELVIALATILLRFVEGRLALGRGSTSHGVRIRSFFPNGFGLNLHLLTLFHHMSLLIFTVGGVSCNSGYTSRSVVAIDKKSFPRNTCGSTGST